MGVALGWTVTAGAGVLVRVGINVIVTLGVDIVRALGAGLHAKEARRKHKIVIYTPLCMARMNLSIMLLL
jgi:hypothetical protein